MSLLIAGYEYADKSLFDEAVDVEVTGAFILADSAITSGNKTLLNEFRKVYRLEARLLAPSFLDARFVGYKTVHQRDTVILGFAGNTLTSQHIFNHIEAHLSQLYVSCTDSFPAEYRVLMPCDRDNPLFRPASQWGDELYRESDFNDLVSGECVSKVIAHAIKGALSSAKQYKLSDAEFETLKTEWVAGIYCRVTQEHRLYRFDVTWAPGEDELMAPTVAITEIPQDMVTILGLPGFDPEAQTIVDAAYQAAKSPREELRDFLGRTISRVRATGSYYIDFPIFEMGIRRGTANGSRTDLP